LVKSWLHSFVLFTRWRSRGVSEICPNAVLVTVCSTVVCRYISCSSKVVSNDLYLRLGLLKVLTCKDVDLVPEPCLHLIEGVLSGAYQRCVIPLFIGGVRIINFRLCLRRSGGLSLIVLKASLKPVLYLTCWGIYRLTWNLTTFTALPPSSSEHGAQATLPICLHPKACLHASTVDKHFVPSRRLKTPAFFLGWVPRA